VPRRPTTRSHEEQAEKRTPQGPNDPDLSKRFSDPIGAADQQTAAAFRPALQESDSARELDPPALFPTSASASSISSIFDHAPADSVLDWSSPTIRPLTGTMKRRRSAFPVAVEDPCVMEETARAGLSHSQRASSVGVACRADQIDPARFYAMTERRSSSPPGDHREPG